jgi:tetratricopeptide (TPR) repeat protein
LFQKNLADCQRVLGGNHPQTLLARINLAWCHQDAGDLARAIPLYEQGLADHLRILGENHPETMMVRNNLANAYQESGDLARAIPLCEQGLADYLRILGENHPHTLVAQSNLAYAYQKSGDLARAILIYEQALSGHVRIFGDDHPKTKFVRKQLAVCARQQTEAENLNTPDPAGPIKESHQSSELIGQREKDLESAEKAIQVLRQSAYADPSKFAPELAKSLEDLAILQWDSGRKKDALATSEQAIQILRRLASANAPHFAVYLASALKSRGAMLFIHGRKTEALSTAEEGVATYRHVVEFNPSIRPELGFSLNLCGSMLKRLARYEDALVYLEEAINMFDELSRQSPGKFSNDIHDALEGIAEVLEHLGRDEDAATARRRINMLGGAG